MEFKDKFSKIELKWINEAKKRKATIVLPEGGCSERTVKAALDISKNNICNLVLLVKNDDFNLDGYKNIRVVNILTDELTPIIENAYFIKRQSKGITKEQASIDIMDVYNYGAMMVDLGLVDGMVAGAEAPSKRVIGSAFKIVKAKTGFASSFFLMLPTQKGDKVYLLSDGGVVIDPSNEELAKIAMQSVDTYRTFFDDEPNVALLSYSTHGSADGDSAIKVREATEILKQNKVDFVFDGELQLDAAIVPEVAKHKAPDSPVDGRANILIFPDLQSGNIGYKLIQRFGHYKAIGPILQGLNKPVNDLSRGASVEEIILAVAVTILQI